jgi:hypothetical protein
MVIRLSLKGFGVWEELEEISGGVHELVLSAS